MPKENSTVYIVDDDASLRKSLTRLLKLNGFNVEAFESAEAFLECKRSSAPACLVLDLSMPGMTGLDLQTTLIEDGSLLPIIFITGHGSVPESVQAIKAGAVEFLEKPFDAEVLIALIQKALAEEAARLVKQDTQDSLVERFASLTDREREVMHLIVGEAATLSSGDIARTLGISPRTIEHHRSRIMLKTQARSVTDLVDLARQAGLDGDLSSS